MVTVLNWLSGGETQLDVSKIRLGCRLNRMQWGVVKRLRPLIDSWNKQGSVGPIEMGRSAPKVETIEAELRRLEEVVAETQGWSGSYFAGVKRGDIQREVGLSGHPGEVVGAMGGCLEHVAKEVEPERLKFHEFPSFNPEPFLDYQNRRVYKCPLDHAEEVDPDDPRLPNVKIRCKAGQKIKIIEKLDEVRRLALLPARSVRRGFENGLFSLVKDAKRDRMILDARRPNFCEASERRWIYTLGGVQQLLHVFLEPQQKLYLYAEDLREFYHCFVIGAQRRQRNILQAYFKPAEVHHLGAFKEELWDEEELVAALDTLAMGDTNAVAFGQVSHLALLLRTNEFQLEDFFGLRMRPSRKRWKAGLVIDDFLVLEARSAEDDPEEVMKKVQKVRDSYIAHGLPRHPDKAVEGELHGEFWGGELDGEVGQIRPSLKRMIPLCNILLEVVRIGHCTVGLLEVISGSLIAAFQFRRRLMSSLSEIYAAQRGRTKADIVRCSKELKSELMCIAGLLPLAVIDMRLQPASFLVASDASNAKGAAVIAEVGVRMTSEMQRHSLQKGLWNRLLSPAAAYLKERQRLGADEELPGETYTQHPLWEEATEVLQFKEFGRIRKVQRRRHINLGEVRAALAAEKLVGQTIPGHYYMHLQDSQVALACMTKGRSASAAINKELRRSIPHVVGCNVRGYYGYIRSKSNPADDPTRAQEVRGATREPPKWWYLESEADFEELDKFLEENHVHPKQISELPDPAELLPDLELDGRSSKEMKQDRGRERRAKARKKDFEDTEAERLEKVSEAAAEAEKTEAERSEDAENVAEAEDSRAGRAEDAGLAGDRSARPRLGENRSEGLSSEKEKKKSSWLGAKQKEVKLLLSFKRSQFIFGERYGSLEEALEQGPGLLDLYSGKRGFARAFVGQGCPWALCFDLKHGEDEDLLEPNLQATLKILLGSCMFCAMAASPVCASFSTAITPPWRTKIWPRGRPGLTAEQKEKIRLGHEQLAFTLVLVGICLNLSIRFWVENPDQSWFWKIDGELSWDAINEDERVGDFRADQCCFGTPWRKRTRFKTSCHLKDQKQLCRCERPHVKLRGRSKEHGMNFTKLAESYPRRLCAVLAASMALDCGLQTGRRHVSVSDCVFSEHKRVGEAKNPGPRQRKAAREGAIDDIQLLEPQTVKIRAKLWTSFSSWVNENVGDGALENMIEAPYVLVKTLESYGKAQYAAGAPLHYYRQLLAHTQREIPLCRPYMQSAWTIVTKWELAEPTQHRPPIPEPLAIAISALALLWNWPKFASTVLLCFYGILRVGEVLNAKRRDLLTPKDLLSQEQEVFLRIRNPKSRGRGPRVQYSTFKKIDYMPIILQTWESLRPDEKLYPLSASAFRRRWDTILRQLGVQTFHRLTPGAMRPGGAVWAHRQGINIQDLLWKMRLQHLRTLGYYLQEVTAVSILPNLTEDSRESIAALLGVMPFLSGTMLSAQTTQ